MRRAVTSREIYDFLKAYEAKYLRSGILDLQWLNQSDSVAIGPAFIAVVQLKPSGEVRYEVSKPKNGTVKIAGQTKNPLDAIQIALNAWTRACIIELKTQAP
jgi:hypothetical protein